MPFKWALQTRPQTSYQALTFYGPYMVVDTNKGELGLRPVQQLSNVLYSSMFSSRDNVKRTNSFCQRGGGCAAGAPPIRAGVAPATPTPSGKSEVEGATGL